MMSEARKRARAKSGIWQPFPNTGGTKPIAGDVLVFPLPDSRPGSNDGRNSFTLRLPPGFPLGVKT
jgi:hypothetical protein